MRILAMCLLAPLGTALLGAASPTPVPSGFSVPLLGPDSKARGTVKVEPHGNQTLVRVTLFNSDYLKAPLTLHEGSDCGDAALGGVHPIPLNPVGTGQSSQTLISVPLENLRSQNFVIDLRNATQRSQFVEGCARLRH